MNGERGSSNNGANDNGDAAVRPSLCVVTPYEPALSETFIRAHLERLPARTSLVSGWPPALAGRPVFSTPRRAYHKLLRTLAGGGAAGATTAAYVAAFRRTGADAVLAEYGTTGAQVYEACRGAGVPLVVHFHGYDASERAVLEEHRETYPAMFQTAAAVVAVSRAMQRKLVSLGAPPERVHYNPYGIDLARFGGADPGAAPPVFLAVGRFVEKKAPQLTLAAFAEVLGAEPGARLRMVGDGPLLEECRALARRLGVEEAVAFLGARGHEEVQAEMRGARCFVQHSVEAANGDCEGTPVGILEAAAAGLPVVSTRHAGIPDVVVEGETGLLVEERDVRGMAAHMLGLARDAGLAGRMGRAARLRATENFSMERSIGNLWAIIESCLPRGKAAGR
ncbi:MAG TPA: glycosyltransferase [Pyrinomonadaceae bacterium]|nr:glycosyltransferase [Pyrinomonadaceae bacterium]